MKMNGKTSSERDGNDTNMSERQMTGSCGETCPKGTLKQNKKKASTIGENRRTRGCKELCYWYIISLELILGQCSFET